MMVARMRLEVARRRGVPDFLFVGKSNTTHASCVPMASAWVEARCESDLYVESCLAALSTTRGEGLFGRMPQLGSIMVRQRGAIE